MALRNDSVAMIDSPEFINLAPDAINPGISQCEIKVFYLGKNRNGSFIDKEVAKKMANTLPGAPIVGKWRKDVEDFSDHGQVLKIEDGKVEFSVETTPYGFVAPDAKVWFQKFKDTDEFGNEVEREYLMTVGYLWTGQYPELNKVIEEGQGQSMELNEDMDGRWATDNAEGVDFFIINDADILKLCILGDDVEPCYEGASVEAPNISKEFAANPNFSRTLFSMIHELKNALENEGGSDMPNEEIQAEVEFAEAEEAEVEAVEAEPEAEFAEVNEAVAELEQVEGDDTAAEFAKEDEDPESEDDSEDASDEEEPEEDEEEENPEVKHELEAEFAELQTKYAALEAEVEELRAFKLVRENADKDALIAKYHMISDEDKAEVVANKEQYSLDEIEGKLALIYVQKNVDFETVDGQAEEPEQSPAVAFSLEDDIETADEADAFLKALRNAKLF